MPKVNLLREDPRKAEIRREIYGTMGELKLSLPELAKRAGINERTMRNRIKDVGTLRLSELWAIQDVQKIGRTFG